MLVSVCLISLTQCAKYIDAELIPVFKELTPNQKSLLQGEEGLTPAHRFLAATDYLDKNITNVKNVYYYLNVYFGSNDTDDKK